MSIYLVVGIAGTVVLLVSLLLGDLLDGLLDGLDGFGGDWFSTEVVGAFVAALGFGGAAATAAGLPDGLAFGVGLGSGTLFAVFGAWLTRLVRSGGTDHTPGGDDVLGASGVVLSQIPDDGLGAVRVHLGGHTLQYSARSELPLEAGTKVFVTAVLSPTAIEVTPVWRDGRPELDVPHA